MKTFGIVLAAVGGMMALSGLKLIFTEYDMNDTHDISKAMGGMGFSVGMIAVGVFLAYKNSGKEKHEEDKSNEE